MTNVFSKLSKARKMLHSMPLKRSGRNNYSKYDYFELGDFLPQTLSIFDELGLCGVVSFSAHIAEIKIVDCDYEKEPSFVVLQCEMGRMPEPQLNEKGMNAIQRLGAAQTYMRRYLWAMTMEIVDNDILDEGVHNEKFEKKNIQPAINPNLVKKSFSDQLDLTRKNVDICKSILGENKIADKLIVFLDRFNKKSIDELNNDQLSVLNKRLTEIIQMADHENDKQQGQHEDELPTF